jgi:hypothetical protein
MSRAALSPVCPACGGSLIRAPYFLVCSEPLCNYVPPIVYEPRSTSPEPASNRDVKVSVSSMLSSKQEGTSECRNSLAVGEQ